MHELHPEHILERGQQRLPRLQHQLRVSSSPDFYSAAAAAAAAAADDDSRPPLSPSLSPSLLLTIPARPQGRLLTQQQVFAAQLKNLTPEGNTCFVFLLVVVVNDVKQTSEGAGLYLWWCE